MTTAESAGEESPRPRCRLEFGLNYQFPPLENGFNANIHETEEHFVAQGHQHSIAIVCGRGAICRQQFFEQAMTGSRPDKQEVEEKEKRLRESIAKNYSHIKNVEVQLAQLQLQLNLTSGPKKSALEMLRKKIEAKNEQVVTARQRFLSTQKAAQQAEEVLQCHERSKQELCQELHLLVHQSATAELNKLEQLTEQLQQLNRLTAAVRGTMGLQPAANMPLLEQARRAAASTHATSAHDAAAATTEQQAVAAASLASRLHDNEQHAPVALVSPGQSSKKLASTAQHQQQVMSGCRTASADHTTQAYAVVPTQPAVKKKINQSRKQLHPSQESSAQAANDSAGKFVGFQS